MRGQALRPPAIAAIKPRLQRPDFTHGRGEASGNRDRLDLLGHDIARESWNGLRQALPFGQRRLHVLTDHRPQQRRVQECGRNRLVLEYALGRALQRASDQCLDAWPLQAGAGARKQLLKQAIFSVIFAIAV